MNSKFPCFDSFQAKRVAVCVRKMSFDLLFGEALECRPDELSPFLSLVCGHDLQLRERLEEAWVKHHGMFSRSDTRVGYGSLPFGDKNSVCDGECGTSTFTGLASGPSVSVTAA